MDSNINELMKFLDKNPTAFHTTASVKEELLDHGFEELLESSKWNLKAGKDYFVCRNSSSILAFRLGCDPDNYSFNIAAAHTDSPCFRIKENAELRTGDKYTRLNTEGYGGMLCSTWMDRPLSIAGRVLIKEGSEIKTSLVNVDRDLLLIPSVAIHMNRDANEKASFNKQIDMLPLFGSDTDEGALKKIIASCAGADPDEVIGSDLYLYIREKASLLGYNNEYISSGRLDDQQCVFAILKGFLKQKSASSINVAVFFDNEEVGSGTKQGASSTFMYECLKRIFLSLGKSEEDFYRAAASGFMFSADNAHAVHPNHPEYTDVNNCTFINKGVVVKSHAGQKYTSDGMSIAVVRELAKRAGIDLQYFANRSDKAGGSTLGNLSMAQLSINCVDIGLPQLAMHSAYETAGVNDISDMIRLFEEFYSCHFEATADGINIK